MKNVQDIYPVSSMQELMLLHSLSRPGTDTLFNQFQFDISGDFDPAPFEKAWQIIVDRHPALRTAFIWRDVKQPLQVVRKTVPAEFRVEDLRDKDPKMQRAGIEDYLCVDRRTGFKLDCAPLMRFCLLRLADDHWRFVWSSHHLVVDRWCLSQIFRELDQYYGQKRTVTVTNQGGVVPGFKEYIDWFLRQDRAATFDYWAAALEGYEPTGSLFTPDPGTPRREATIRRSAERVLDKSIASALGRFARKNALTPGLVAQAAWALTLNNVLRSQDVLFGATVSGRPADIPDVESIVGSFINNVPVRSRLPGSMHVEKWLGDLQAQQFARAPHEYLSAAELKRGLGADQRCMEFESLLVWLADVEDTSRIEMLPVSATFATAYPLTISLSQGLDGLCVRAVATKHCTRSVEDMLDVFAVALGELVRAGPDTSLTDLRVFTKQPGFDETRTGVETAESAGRRLNAGGQPAVADVGGGREKLGIDVLREVVQTEWSAVLGAYEAAGDADFFEMGCTSLQAAALHSRIEVATRRSIPMLALFKDPTIDGMTAVLFAKDWPVRTDIVNRVRAGRGRAPLFCIASPEVNTVGYSLLARHLDDDQGIYVLQSPPEDGRLRQVQPGYLPELATQYVERMRRVQPRGPYRFMGMCTGSHIALEMTRQLEAEREQVEFFGIINTWALYTISRLYYLNRMMNIARYYLNRLRELAPTPSIRHAAHAADTQQSISGRTHVIPAESLDGVGSAWIRDVGFAARNPGLPRLSTRATVFRLRRQAFWRIRDAGLGWSIHVGDVDIVPVSGNNHDLLMREPYISEVAAAINDRLRSLEEEWGQAFDTETTTGGTR